jgi:hypothetical protein
MNGPGYLDRFHIGDRDTLGDDRFRYRSRSERNARGEDEAREGRTEG